jgi:hypothetical protein
VCSLPIELRTQADSLLDDKKSLREISHILSLAGKQASFMAIARHRRHYGPGLSAEERLYVQQVEGFEKELQKLKNYIARRSRFKVYGL